MLSLILINLSKINYISKMKTQQDLESPDSMLCFTEILKKYTRIDFHTLSAKLTSYNNEQASSRLKCVFNHSCFSAVHRSVYVNKRAKNATAANGRQAVGLFRSQTRCHPAATAAADSSNQQHFEHSWHTYVTGQ
jgi:hypothetical protein